MTRIERGESWLQYEHFSGNVSNVMVSVDRERIAVGARFGFSFAGIGDEFCASFGAQPGSLPSVAAQIVKLRNGAPLGPANASTRYLTEDVPFGLRFLSLAGTLVDVPTPATNACITTANIALGPALISDNKLLGYVRRYAFSRQRLEDFAEGRFA
jgi:opine dehydrogenase